MLMKCSDFRQICMTLDTNEGSLVRAQYMMLAEIFKRYILYQNYEKKLNNNLSEQKEPSLDLIVSKIEKLDYKNEYIDIMSNDEYSAQNLWKIVSSQDNTTNTLDNDFLNIYERFWVFDAKTAQNRIECLLKNLAQKHALKWYFCTYDLINKIIKSICNDLENEYKQTNEMIKKLNKIKT